MEGISSGPDEIETKNREGSVPQRPVLVMLIDSTVLFHLCGDGGRDIHYLFTKRQAEKIVSVPCHNAFSSASSHGEHAPTGIACETSPRQVQRVQRVCAGLGWAMMFGAVPATKECHGSTRQRSTKHQRTRRSPPVGAVVNERRSMRASFNWVNSSGQMTGSQTW